MQKHFPEEALVLKYRSRVPICEVSDLHFLDSRTTLNLTGRTSNALKVETQVCPQKLNLKAIQTLQKSLNFEPIQAQILKNRIMNPFKPRFVYENQTMNVVMCWPPDCTHMLELLHFR